MPMDAEVVIVRPVTAGVSCHTLEATLDTVVLNEEKDSPDLEEERLIVAPAAPGGAIVEEAHELPGYRVKLDYFALPAAEVLHQRNHLLK